MAIRLVKVITGEDVIADVELASGVYTLKNPVRVMLARDGLGIAPWTPPIKEKSVKVRFEHVMFTAELDDEIYNAYNARFGSGIVLSGAIPPSLDLSGIEE